MKKTHDLDREQSNDEGWSRFERAVDAAIKSGPRHKSGKAATRGSASVSSFLFDTKSVETLKKSFKRLCDRGFNRGLLNCSLDVSKPVERRSARLARNDLVIGWAAKIDDNWRPTFVALDGDFNVVVAHD
jgi:hypothetical protein